MEDLAIPIMADLAIPIMADPGVDPIEEIERAPSYNAAAEQSAELSDAEEMASIHFQNKMKKKQL